MNYWEKRKAYEMYERMDSAEKTADRIGIVYHKASNYLTRDMDQIFERFEKKHRLTKEEAAELLSNIKDKHSLEDIKRELAKAPAGSEKRKLLAELEAPAYRARLDRLNEKQQQIDQVMQQVYGQEKKISTSHYSEFIKETYNKSIFGIQKQAGVGFSFAQIDENTIDKLLKSKWSGKNYSARIWDNTRKLANTLKTELLVGMLTGEREQDISKRMLYQFAAGAKDARRLVRTESCYISTEMDMRAYEECGIDTYIFVATLDLKTSEICASLDGQRFKVKDKQSGVNAPPMHPWCRSTTISNITDEELAEMKRRARNPKTGKPELVPADMTYKDWKKTFVKSAPLEDIRTPVDIEFDTAVSGYKGISGYSVQSNGQKYGQESKIVTLNKRNTTEFDELPTEIRERLQYTSMGNKPFHLAKGNYEVQRYVEGSLENSERDEIAKVLDAEYIGFSFQQKKGQPFFIDFYQKGDDLLYSIGKADVQKSIKDASLDAIEKIATEREKLIIDNIGDANLKNISVRSGDDWVTAMKKFHRSIQADGKPTILPDADYDAVKSPTLYRGIAPQSRLRGDITTDSTTKEMADEFFKGDSPFPSRGVYGDGVAYAAPSYKEIAWNYATQGGKQLHGGVIIEFKLKDDARTILYEDALEVFRKMSKKGGSKLLFNPNQQKAYDKEVGKAMNALGYDAILKHNGDNTGIDFYVVLNRAALVTKQNYITTAL